MSKVDLINSPIVQSPYTYLQAAGSDGSDRTVKGNHLRWDFLKTLGENHLAKGNYTASDPYISTTGFNRQNDFIKIFRTKFRNKHFVSMNFNVGSTTVVSTGTTRAWKYTLPVEGLTGVTTNVTVRFVDYTQYDIIRAAQSTFNTINLLNAYTGIVEVETDNKLAFYAELDVKTKVVGGAYLRLETVTIPDTSDFTQKQVSCRKKFVGNPQLKTITSENIQYLRFDYFKAEWKEIRLYCYEDYIAGTNDQSAEGKWDFVGDFALTTDDVIAQNRFMPVEVDGAGGHWPKFNDDDPTTGEFTVRKQNYYQRWRRPGFTFDPIVTTGNDFNGAQHFVHTYMMLSKTDERALASIPSDTPGDLSTQDISYVDMIRLMSLDYHVARILGLGYIDDARKLERDSYIYCLEYKTFVRLGTPYTTDVERTHVFMTIPVLFTDYRYPPVPALTPLTYGISVDNGTPTPTMLTDENGYAPFGNVRFININRGPFNYEKPFGPFYYDPTEYCLCNETQPIAFGLEYKEINEANYRKPEISHDSEYFDTSGLAETIPILEGGTPKIYTHQEDEEGTHEYKSYAINWFSRVSPLSNPVQAVTAFPKQSNLLPPFNFAVQLIQDEDPSEPNIAEKTLILTTQAEQNILAIIPPANDKTLVRTTFDWNHVHHNAHQYADYADIFFRRAEPLIVKGEIASVNLLSGNRAQITTTSYIITSTFPETTVIPTILTSDATKFIGSFFSAGGENYVIESVIASGVNPTFIIKQLKKNEPGADPLHPGLLISVETFQSPSTGDRFFVAENMNALSNWDLRHSKRVYLEKFYTNAKVTLRISPTRTSTYDIKSVAPSGGGNTNIEVEKPIDTLFSAGLTLEYSVKHKITAIATNTFTISGDSTADFTTGKPFRVFANKANDSLYTVNSSSFVSGSTVIIANETIPDIANTDGLIEIVVSRNVIAINNDNSIFIISGNQIAEINSAYLEYKLENDGTYSRFVVGGINDIVDFEPLLTNPPLPADIEGTGFIQLKFHNYDLLPHPDPEVNWYKGIVRLKDVGGNVQVYPVTYIGNLTTTTAPHLAIVIQDPGFFPKSDPNNITGDDIYTLNLNVSQNANYHPSYKLYLTADNGINPTTGTPLPSSAINFDSNDILPLATDPNEGNRQTYMAIRSYDAKNDLESFLSNPVVLLAQKISPPVAPNQPTGPMYATRPDFYGKSTYTFDTKLNTDLGRVPYSVVFYRTSEDRVLDVLYKKTTQEAIWTALNALVDPLNPDGSKVKHDPLLWQILFGAQSDGANFATYNVAFGSYTWPLPDNDEFALTYETNKALSDSNPAGGIVFPFKDSFNFKFDTSVFTIYGKPWTPHQILKRAIQDAFLPLNEQPPIFNYLKQGTITSAVKAKTRDASGNLLDPLTNDIFPMIRILPGSETIVRYTDYTLDGASNSLYFYRALEMDDKFKFSEASLPVGPVLMVNTFPPEKPQIRKLLTQLENSITNTPTSVLFEINEYSASDKISKIEIYRAINEIDALSIRTMKKVKSIIWGMTIIDDFSDLPNPPYGESIYYRIAAIREVEDVIDVLLEPPLGLNDPTPTKITELPSLPSEVSKIEIVDVVNPEPPAITITSDPITTTPPIELDNVVLSWNKTAYNGNYVLYKMNSSGNWQKIYQIRTNDDLITVNLADTDWGSGSLLKKDDDDNELFHRFKVGVENASGLLNLKDEEKTI